MFKVKFIAWPADDISFKIESELQDFRTDDESLYFPRVMTRPWKRDTNFTEVGVFTEDLEVARFLAERLNGKIWQTEAPH